MRVPGALPIAARDEEASAIERRWQGHARGVRGGQPDRVVALAIGGLGRRQVDRPPVLVLGAEQALEHRPIQLAGLAAAPAVAREHRAWQEQASRQPFGSTLPKTARLLGAGDQRGAVADDVALLDRYRIAPVAHGGPAVRLGPGSPPAPRQPVGDPTRSRRGVMGFDRRVDERQTQGQPEQQHQWRPQNSPRGPVARRRAPRLARTRRCRRSSAPETSIAVRTHGSGHRIQSNRVSISGRGRGPGPGRPAPPPACALGVPA